MRRERLLEPDPAKPAAPPTDRETRQFQVQEEQYGGLTPALLVTGDSLARQWPQGELARLGIEPLARLATSGDLTQHVLWRLQNTRVDLSGVKLAVLIAGSNNLSAGHAADDIFRGVLALVAAIRTRAPDALIAVFQVPPRVHRHNYSAETHAALNRMIGAGGEANGYVAIPAPDMDPGDAALFKDGLHMERAGYWRMMDSLAATLGLTVKSRREALDPDPGS